MRLHPFFLASGLLLAAVLSLAGCDVVGGDSEPPPLATQFTVSGLIVNSTARPIPGALVHVGSFDTTTDEEGRYSVEVLAGDTYFLSIEAPGYTTYEEENLVVRVDRVVDRTLLGPNQVNGQVVNSQTGQGLDAALVAFIRPEDSNDNPHLIDVADNMGFFNIQDAPNGLFRLCIRKVGFLEFCQENVQITGGTFALDPIALAEIPPAGSIRIVLTWGQSPNDLDSHLTGPLGSSARFHVYYANRSGGDATLDHDDTNSFGPETITITDPEDGMYRYSVHNFSDQSSTGGQGIAASPTRVQVYNEQGLLKSYTAPAAGNGNTWRVFETTVSGSNRTFNDNGGASLGYFTASGSGDTTVFLTGGGDGPTQSKVAER